MKRRQAIWELLHSEASFLQRHLLVLRNVRCPRPCEEGEKVRRGWVQVYMEPLKSCQVEGFLLDLEPELLFGNLEELCKVSPVPIPGLSSNGRISQVSFAFCCRFLDMRAAQSPLFGTTDMILSLFEEVAASIGVQITVGAMGLAAVERDRLRPSLQGLLHQLQGQHGVPRAGAADPGTLPRIRKSSLTYLPVDSPAIVLVYNQNHLVPCHRVGILVRSVCATNGQDDCA